MTKTIDNAERFLNALRMEAECALEQTDNVHDSETVMVSAIVSGFTTATYWLVEEVMNLNGLVEVGRVTTDDTNDALILPTNEFLSKAINLAESALDPESASMTSNKVETVVAEYFAEVIVWLDGILDFYKKPPEEYAELHSKNIGEKKRNWMSFRATLES